MHTPTHTYPSLCAHTPPAATHTRSHFLASGRCGRTPAPDCSCTSCASIISFAPPPLPAPATRSKAEEPKRKGQRLSEPERNAAPRAEPRKAQSVRKMGDEHAVRAVTLAPPPPMNFQRRFHDHRRRPPRPAQGPLVSPAAPSSASAARRGVGCVALPLCPTTAPLLHNTSPLLHTPLLLSQPFWTPATSSLTSRRAPSAATRYVPALSTDPSPCSRSQTLTPCLSRQLIWVLWWSTIVGLLFQVRQAASATHLCHCA